MVHYSCDLCKRPLDSQDDLRYVVKLEIYAAFDPLEIDDEDTDNLQELSDLLKSTRRHAQQRGQRRGLSTDAL